MIAKRVSIIAIALMIGSVAGAMATITCTLTINGVGRVTVEVSTDSPPLVESLIVTETAATVDIATCHNATLPGNFCKFTAKSTGDGSEVEVHLKDSSSDVFQPCGPYTGVDGLPVELLEFSVE